MRAVLAIALVVLVSGLSAGANSTEQNPTSLPVTWPLPWLELPADAQLLKLPATESLTRYKQDEYIVEAALLGAGTADERKCWVVAFQCPHDWQYIKHELEVELDAHEFRYLVRKTAGLAGPPKHGVQYASADGEIIVTLEYHEKPENLLAAGWRGFLLMIEIYPASYWQAEGSDVMSVPELPDSMIGLPADWPIPELGLPAGARLMYLPSEITPDPECTNGVTVSGMPISREDHPPYKLWYARFVSFDMPPQWLQDHIDECLAPYSYMQIPRLVGMREKAYRVWPLNYYVPANRAMIIMHGAIHQQTTLTTRWMEYECYIRLYDEEGFDEQVVLSEKIGGYAWVTLDDRISTEEAISEALGIREE